MKKLRWVILAILILLIIILTVYTYKITRIKGYSPLLEGQDFEENPPVQTSGLFGCLLQGIACDIWYRYYPCQEACACGNGCPSPGLLPSGPGSCSYYMNLCANSYTD